MNKSYFIKENKKINENVCSYGSDCSTFTIFDPHIIFLNKTSEEFTLDLYEKLYEIIGKSSKIDLEDSINIDNVKIDLNDVLKDSDGNFNYKIKDLDIIDIDTLIPLKFSDNKGVKFFVRQKLYLMDTEDDFEITFKLVECESIEKFKDLYKKECERSAKKGESVYLSELFFNYDDAYEVTGIKKGKQIIHIRYPEIVEFE